MPHSDDIISGLMKEIAELRTRLEAMEDAHNDMLSSRLKSIHPKWGRRKASTDGSVGAFIEAMVVSDAESSWPAADLYATYAQWCKTNRRTALASNKFGVHMRQLGHTARKTSRCQLYRLRRRQ